MDARRCSRRDSSTLSLSDSMQLTPCPHCPLHSQVKALTNADHLPGIQTDTLCTAPAIPNATGLEGGAAELSRFGSSTLRLRSSSWEPRATVMTAAAGAAGLQLAIPWRPVACLPRWRTGLGPSAQHWPSRPMSPMPKFLDAAYQRQPQLQKRG